MYRKKTKKRCLKPRRRRQRRIKIRIIRRILGRGVTRPYVDKRERLMLGSGSVKKAVKQKGGFFPLGAALATAPPIIDLLGKIIK